MSAAALPSPIELVQLDDDLADEGVPIFSRPFEAAKQWADNHGGIMFALQNEAWFKNAYVNLHPSVDFSADSFLTLAASARGISYFLKPPVVLGAPKVQPLSHVVISEPEIERLYAKYPASFWELQWQAYDGVDLFMAFMNFHPTQNSAKNMMVTASNQLTASSRQLIASEIDASLPQGVAMAVELAGKAVLASLGAVPKELKALGHDLPALAAMIAAKCGSPCDAAVADAATKLPKYVEVRYDAPILTIIEAQNLFARALFVVADFLRRTNHDQIYWKALQDKTVPQRTFNQM